MLFWLCNVCNLDMSDLKFNSAVFYLVPSCDAFVSPCSEIVQSAIYKSTNVNSIYFNQAIFDMWCIKIFKFYICVAFLNTEMIPTRGSMPCLPKIYFTKPGHKILSSNCTFVKRWNSPTHLLIQSVFGDS